MKRQKTDARITESVTIYTLVDVNSYGILQFILLLTICTLSFAQHTSEPCRSDKFYCDAKDPGKFHRCINGEVFQFRCPVGLHFSVTYQVCQWPGQSDCSKRMNESPAENKNKTTLYRGKIRRNKGRQSIQSPPEPTDQSATRTEAPSRINATKAANRSETSISNQAAASSLPWWARGTDLSQWQALDKKDEKAPTTNAEPSDGSGKKRKKANRTRRPWNSSSRRNSSRHRPNSRSKFRYGRRRPPYYNRRRYYDGDGGLGNRMKFKKMENVPIF